MSSKKPLLLDSELAQKVDSLNKALNDAVKRYKTLIQIAKSEKLMNFYTKKLLERETFKDELKPFVEDFQLKKTKKDTLSGAFTRLHANIKALFDDDEDEVSLTKAMYHEESLLYDYDIILRKPEIIPTELLALLKEHKHNIKEDVDKIKHLNDIH